MDKLKNLLQKHGIKSNANRIAVLQKLSENEKAFSLFSLSSVLKGTMDRTTVYRTLLLLTEKKILHKIPCTDGNTLYALNQANHDAGNSTSFRCKCCQKVETLPDLPAEYLGKLSQYNINLEAIAIEGYCADCRQ